MGQNRDRVLVMSVDEEEVSYSRKVTHKTRNGGLKQDKKEKFKEERKVLPLVAKTNAQVDYIKSLETNKISIASGHSGCGKSFVAAYKAAQMLLDGTIERVYITRPYAHLGKDYGATSGNDFEKLEPFCKPILEVFRRVLGDSKYKYMLAKGELTIAPLEKIQGRSFDEPCAVICDESQCATKPQLLSLVTRIGEGVEFLAILGDPRQAISQGRNALDWITDFFVRNEIGGVGVTYFTEEDCVRSGIVRDILIAFEKEGGFYNQL